MTAAVRETIIPWPRQHQLCPGAGAVRRTEAPAAALLGGRGLVEVSRGSRGGDVAVSQAAAFLSPKSSFPVQLAAAVSLLGGWFWAWGRLGAARGDPCAGLGRKERIWEQFSHMGAEVTGGSGAGLWLSPVFYQPHQCTPRVPVLGATGTASWKAGSEERWFGRRCHLTAGELHPALRNAAPSPPVSPTSPGGGTHTRLEAAG